MTFEFSNFLYALATFRCVLWLTVSNWRYRTMNETKGKGVEVIKQTTAFLNYLFEIRI